jgi:hypothetical protein
VAQRKKGEETATGGNGIGSGAGGPSVAGLRAPRTAAEGKAKGDRRKKKQNEPFFYITNGNGG